MSDHGFIAEYLSQYYDEASPKKFYRAVFPMGSLEQAGVREKGKYTGVAVEILPERKDGRQVTRRYTITDDLNMIDQLIKSDEFIIISPISYAGKSRESKNARYLHGIAIDLDGVDKLSRLQDLIHQMDTAVFLPKATYMVASGTGLHLYYLFQEPVPCFKNITKQLSVLKTALVRKIWNMYVTSLSNHVQIQSLFQGFRMVGGITKVGTRVRAFETGQKVTIEYLNEFVNPEYQATQFTYKSKLLLSEAKVKYPEWYEKRIVQGRKKGTWTCKRDLYEWWKRRLLDEIREGHRYYGIMCLAVYAKKCGIEYDELSRDAFGMLEAMERLTRDETNHFTDYDITAALDMYNDNYITFPIDTISELTQLPIQKNKRNYQRQADHLEEARAIRDIRMRRKGKAWDAANGRKTKASEVISWRLEHPEGTKAECIKDTGLSKPTVYRHWNAKPANRNSGIPHIG